MQRLQDALEHGLRLLQHFVVPEAKHSKPCRFERRGACRILGEGLGVLRSVHFDNQFLLQAHEIEDVIFEWVLTAELHPQLFAPYAMPKLSFCVGHASAQPDGAFASKWTCLAVHRISRYPMKPIPTPARPRHGMPPSSSPFKGESGRGMGRRNRLAWDV